VNIPIGTLCPCSKEISDYGAHNQRGYAKITIKPKKKGAFWELIWIEELVEVADKAASAPIYPLLKREDERYVTMHAYDNPNFVEDVVRTIALNLKTDKRIQAFNIFIKNQESIHNHNAFAQIRYKL
jgi:GTP cyclohydrolase I